MKVALIDVDGTLADLETPWLKWVQDNLYPDLKEFTQWAIHELVGGDLRVYEYLQNPHVYDDVLPYHKSLEGVKTVAEYGYKLYFHTSCTIAHAYTKFYWLRKYGFPVTEDNYVEIRDKSILCGDLLIDDGPHNLEDCENVDYKIMPIRPWNRLAVNNGYYDMYTWEDIDTILGWIEHEEERLWTI